MFSVSFSFSQLAMLCLSCIANEAKLCFAVLFVSVLRNLIACSISPLLVTGVQKMDWHSVVLKKLNGGGRGLHTILIIFQSLFIVPTF